MTTRTIALPALALLCFAGNSILCRLALAPREIDAASFTAVRLVTGALVLAGLAGAASRGAQNGGEAPRARRDTIVSALALFGYAAPFSYAYLRLRTGVGALILFALVQVTMIGWGIARGERPRPVVWLGLVLALGGLVLLTAPGATAPDPAGAAAMAFAGAMWGAYSLRGRRSSSNPLLTTAKNFAAAVPLAALLLLGASRAHDLSATPRGVVLASVSGAVASGVGYSLWYAALRELTATRAAVLQLLVPILAAVGGVLLLGEHVSARLLLASCAILGGVALALGGRPQPAVSAGAPPREKRSRQA